VLLLQFARRYVVDDRIAEHERHRVVAIGNTPAPPDHDRDLGLVVDRACGIERALDCNPGADHRRRRLRKDDRMVGNFAATDRTGVEAAGAELERMVVIVLADAEDVAAGPRNGRDDVDAAGLDRRPRLHGPLDDLPDRTEPADEIDHVDDAGRLRQVDNAFGIDQRTHPLSAIAAKRDELHRSSPPVAPRGERHPCDRTSPKAPGILILEPGGRSQR
jgi:hypothetical protein